MVEGFDDGWIEKLGPILGMILGSWEELGKVEGVTDGRNDLLGDIVGT